MSITLAELVDFTFISNTNPISDSTIKLYNDALRLCGYLAERRFECYDDFNNSYDDIEKSICESLPPDGAELIVKYRYWIKSRVMQTFAYLTS